ncbi:hypothetical protein HYT60_01670 [Candidatus Woesebacteria bacterium]|nr:hypothetical protein [Candidatus Woesebacteria bacterium]
MKERVRNYIRVIDTPPGGAPDPIRQEWVEMYLPLARELAQIAEELFGVDGEELPDDSEFFVGFLSDDIETGQKTTANANGYVVDAEEAIEMLEKKGTESGRQAAQYWKQKLIELYGHYRGTQLTFDRNVCEFIRKRGKHPLT